MCPTFRGGIGLGPDSTPVGLALHLFDLLRCGLTREKRSIILLSCVLHSKAASVSDRIQRPFAWLCGFWICFVKVRSNPRERRNDERSCTLIPLRGTNADDCFLSGAAASHSPLCGIDCASRACESILARAILGVEAN